MARHILKCEICRGSRIIKLPVYRQLSAISELPARGEMLEAPYRTFACPECAEQVSTDRIAVVDVHTLADSRYPNDPAFRDHVREAAAYRLVSHLLAKDLISFEEGPIDGREFQFPMIATLGVVAKGQVATIEQRIVERQHQLAVAAGEEAVTQINNFWQRNPDIRKHDAAWLIRDAVKHVSETWSKASSLKKADQP